jgi:glutathione S-transferase
MKIYCGYKSFTRDCRPRWLLEELGVAYEVIQVDIFAGEGHKPAYLAKNPLGKVPFLEDGDAGIFESGAIVAYLADKFGIPRIAPELTSQSRAEYLQWMFFAPVTLDSPATRLAANRYMFPSKEGAEERAIQAAKELAGPAKVLERALTGRPFLVGGEFSAADVMVGSALVWADKARGIEDYPALKAYVGRLAERPAFQKAYAPTEREYTGHEGRAAAG